MYDKNSFEYWDKKITKKCKTCYGQGYIVLDDDTRLPCNCKKLATNIAKMYDPERGLRKELRKISIDMLKDNMPDVAYNKILGFKKVGLEKGKNTFSNIIISGKHNTGKSSIAAVLYKMIMLHNYTVSRFDFAELVTLSRLYMSNSQTFNTKLSEVDLLKNENFIIIEDVDNRGLYGHANYEKIGFGLLDEIFSFRSKHARRSTIITKDSNEPIQQETLGQSYYKNIYNTKIENDTIKEICLDEED